MSTTEDTASLPEEIAELIEHVRMSPDNDAVPQSLADEVAAALLQQAREIERLKGIERREKFLTIRLTEHSTSLVDANDRVAELEAHCDRLGRGGAERYWEGRWRDADARIRELEAERDRLRSLATTKGAIGLLEDQMRRNQELRAERDAIKEKTIEECAVVGDAIAKIHGEDAMKRCAGNDWAAASAANARAEGATEVTLAIHALKKPQAETE